MFHVMMRTFMNFDFCFDSWCGGEGRVWARLGDGNEGRTSCNLAKIPFAYRPTTSSLSFLLAVEAGPCCGIIGRFNTLSGVLFTCDYEKTGELWQ